MALLGRYPQTLRTISPNVSNGATENLFCVSFEAQGLLYPKGMTCSNHALSPVTSFPGALGSVSHLTELCSTDRPCCVQHGCPCQCPFVVPGIIASDTWNALRTQGGTVCGCVLHVQLLFIFIHDALNSVLLVWQPNVALMSFRD